jgi:hypothetical protein
MDRACFYLHADVVDGVTYGTRAVGQKRSNVRGPESKKACNMKGPSFLISVELRFRAVKRRRCIGASDLRPAGSFPAWRAPRRWPASEQTRASTADEAAVASSKDEII